MNRRDAMGLVVLGVAAAGAWTWRDSLGPERDQQEDAVATVASYYLRGTEIVTPGEDGRPLYRLLAEEMRRAVDSELISMRDVTLEYNHESPEPWIMTADHGEVRLDWETIELSGAVVITARTEDDVPARLNTEHLLVMAATHRASTDGEVTMALGDEQVRGTGMMVDLMAGRVMLESQVNGVFTP